MLLGRMLAGPVGMLACGAGLSRGIGWASRLGEPFADCRMPSTQLSNLAIARSGD
jgi:hypothetical protein